MTADELVGRAQKAMADAEERGCNPTAAAVRVVVEEAAKVADRHKGCSGTDTECPAAIAHAIRALAPEPPR